MTSGVDWQQCGLKNTEEIKVESLQKFLVLVFSGQIPNVIEEDHQAAIEAVACNLGRSPVTPRSPVVHGKKIVFVVLKKRNNSYGQDTSSKVLES